MEIEQEPVSDHILFCATHNSTWTVTGTLEDAQKSAFEHVEATDGMCQVYEVNPEEQA